MSIRKLVFRTGIALLMGLMTTGLAEDANAELPANYSKPQLLKESVTDFSNPADLAIAPDGGYLLVADTGNNEIKVLQPGTLKILSRFGSDVLDGPNKVEFAANGNLRVIDDGFKRVTAYAFKGVFRDGSANAKHLGTTSLSSGQAKGPYSATDADGQSYVIDGAKHRVIILDKDGNRIGIYGDDQLKSPGSVETVGRYFWIADTGNNRILLLKAPRPIDH